MYAHVQTHATVNMLQYLHLWDMTTFVTQAVKTVSSSSSMETIHSGMGKDVVSSVPACCSWNTPPWFMKQLSCPTSDDIEMRLCSDQNRNDEDITVESLEIYVQ